MAYYEEQLLKLAHQATRTRVAEALLVIRRKFYPQVMVWDARL